MILPSPNTKQGFFSVHFILIFGVLLIFLFGFSFISFVAQAKMQFRSICLTESAGLQKNIIYLEKQLFLLNTLSTALDIQYKLAMAAVGPLPGNPAALIRVAQIQLEQMRLDNVQRGIITASKITIDTNLATTKAKIFFKARELSSLWAVYLGTAFSVDVFRTEMAVRPRTSGIAPNYELKPNYKAIQTVAYNWQFKYFTKPESQKVVDSQNTFSLSCAIQPDRKDDLWTLEIQKDRYF